MLKLTHESELLESFRLIDREIVNQSMPAISFPVPVRDYLAWVEPSGARLFVVYEDPSTHKPFGIVFRRDQGLSDVPQMCELCHTTGTQSVSLLTAEASGNRRVGIPLCRDLACKDQPEVEPTRLLRRLSSFARQNLF